VGRDDDERYDAELFRLRGALAEGLRDSALAEYDLILIDCPPDFNIMTKAAIVACDHMVIPAKADHLSTLGIEYLWGTARRVRRTCRRSEGRN
jgi:chromosome partitioning protein